MKTALLIGGGIGGLASAICLRRAGFRTLLFEQAPALRETGAGITLWSDAMRVLQDLGLGSAVLRCGALLERGEVRSHTGRVLADVALGPLARQLGAPILGIQRSELLGILAQHIDPADLHVGARLHRYEIHPRGVTAHFTDGRQAHGDLLIGADGIHSRVRELLLNDPLRYAGYVGWRGGALFKGDALEGGKSIWSFGRGGQFGLIPIGNERVFWFGTANVAQEAIGDLGPHLDELKRRFKHWHSPIPEFLDSIDPETILHTPIYDRAPARLWGRGCVTLLGDAAHATTPTLGHGACMAIESASVLANHLRHASVGLEESLRRYESQRQKRTAWIIRQSWRMGKVIQWKSPVACWMRNLALRWTPDRVNEAILRKSMGFECRPALSQSASL